MLNFFNCTSGTIDACDECKHASNHMYDQPITIVYDRLCFLVTGAFMLVMIFHYLAVAVAKLDYFETCGFLLLRHNADYVLQTCFHLLHHLVRSSLFDSFFGLLHNSVKPWYVLALVIILVTVEILALVVSLA